jgi:hypothetical protein
MDGFTPLTTFRQLGGFGGFAYPGIVIHTPAFAKTARGGAPHRCERSWFRAGLIRWVRVGGTAEAVHFPKTVLILQRKAG